MTTDIRRINPPALATPPGYSHVVTAPASRVAYISGQVAMDGEGNLVVPGDFRAQVEQVFSNLKTALEAAGSDFAHVIKLTYFVTELDRDKLGLIREVRNRHIDPAKPPASTLVGVAKLFPTEYLLEVEAVAAIAY